MAKLTSSAAALLAALLLVAHAAAAFRTTITTVESTENFRSRQECQQQVRSQARGLNQCRMYLQEQMHGGSYDELANYSQSLNQCCTQLRQLSEDCRCEGLRMAIEDQQGRMRSQDVRQMLQMAENLPSMCQMTRPSSCDFDTSYY